MSSEQKPPLNLYGILDNEMSRMHALMQTYLSLPTQHNPGYGGLSSSSSFSSHGNMSEIYKRILTMQDLLLHAVVHHDKIIQEKIAEMALTGNSNET